MFDETIWMFFGFALTIAGLVSLVWGIESDDDGPLSWAAFCAGLCTFIFGIVMMGTSIPSDPGETVTVDVPPVTTVLVWHCTPIEDGSKMLCEK